MLAGGCGASLTRARTRAPCLTFFLGGPALSGSRPLALCRPQVRGGARDGLPDQRRLRGCAELPARPTRLVGGQAGRAHPHPAVPPLLGGGGALRRKGGSPDRGGDSRTPLSIAVLRSVVFFLLVRGGGVVLLPVAYSSRSVPGFLVPCSPPPLRWRVCLADPSGVRLLFGRGEQLGAQGGLPRPQALCQPRPGGICPHSQFVSYAPASLHAALPVCIVCSCFTPRHTPSLYRMPLLHPTPHSQFVSYAPASPTPHTPFCISSP